MPEKCRVCHYSRSIPGNCHLSCMRKFEKLEDIPASDPHGVASGWCMFPVNFDPVWLSDCGAFDAKGKGDDDNLRGEMPMEGLFKFF